MKNSLLPSALALLAVLTTSCDLDVGSGTSSSELEAARAQATSNSSATSDTSAAAEDDATDSQAETTVAEKPASTSAATPAAAPAPAPAPVVVPKSSVVTPINTGGALYQAGGNSLTLRSDFAAVARRVDALVNINESAPGVASSNAIPATRTGNTWVIPQALASYPTGNRPNTWRISLAGTPPAGVTYHTSISQTFIRTTDFGTGKTYPPTTRR